MKLELEIGIKGNNEVAVLTPLVNVESDRHKMAFF